MSDVYKQDRADKASALRLAALGFCSLAFLLFAQSHAERNLWQAWQTEEYSHGIVVVLLGLLIALHKLHEAKPGLTPSWLGVPFLVLAGCMQLIAQLAAFDTIAEYGLIVGFGGLCLSFLGRRATGVVLPGLVYLIFAVPLPHLFQATLSQKMQLLSSSLGVMPLDLLGIPVFQEGNVIDLGSFRLQVVEACNGLRYLFPLMSFGYLVALLLEARFWKRAVIFLSTIPIAILLNATRIAVIGVTVDLWGQKMAEGFIHDFEGWSVFILCLALLFGETYLLQHIGQPGRFRYDYLGLPKRPWFSGSSKRQAPPVAAFVVAFVSAFLFDANLIQQRAEIHPAHPPLASFPLTLGVWEGKQSSLDSDVLSALQLSDYYLADYKSSDAPAPINFYIAYYDSQRIGTTTHSPSNCIPGGGWQIESSAVKTLPLPSGVHLKFTQLLIRRGSNAQVIDYWFQERGRDLTETTIAKWYLLVDSLFMHRTDGALVRLGTPLAPGENQTTADARLNGFLALANAPLTVFIPSAPTH